ncbi:MAG: rhodanese-like domain-containing protein [Gemmatimonadota bacterium]
MLNSLLLLGYALAAPAPRPDLLVTARWLAEHLNDPKVVILHVAHERKEYDQGHVPGARFISAMVLFDDREPGVEIPTAERLDSIFESLGISDDSRVILYGDTWMMPRAFLDLDYVGHGDRTALLDGGLRAWTASGKPLSTEAPTVKRGSFTPHIRTDLVVDAAWIRSHANDPDILLLDGRSRPEYDGPASREQIPRHGHIPGAVFFPWNATYTDSAAALKGNSSPFIDAAKLQGLFAAAGAGGGKQIVTYCTVGLRASHLYFIARLMGYSPKIYDGSMADYAARAELPLVTAPAPPAKK